MKTTALLHVLLVLALAGSASADELEPSAFSGPSGLQGAGLSLNTDRRARMFAEQSHFYSDGSYSIGWTLGAGYQFQGALEIELGLGAASTSFRTEPRQTHYALGNLAASANYLAGGTSWILKAGLGVSAGPWNQYDPTDYRWSNPHSVLGSADAVQSYQAGWLSSPYRLHLYTPVRFELGRQVRFTTDVNFNLGLETSDDLRTLARLQVAPGVNWLPTDWLILGVRAPTHLHYPRGVGVTWVRQHFQASVEPHLRLDVKQLFVSTRFTYNLNKSLGPSFSDDSMYGWHFAVGGGF